MQDASVTSPKLFKARFKTALKLDQRVATGGQALVVAMHISVCCMGLEQIVGHGGHQGPGQKERKRHGKHHRFCHGHKQEPRNPVQKEHGYKHNTNTQQRDKGWCDDLCRTVQDGSLHIFTLLKVPVDVFNGHGGIVHQNTNSQCQAPKRHDVERFTKSGQSHDGTQDGQRDRDGNDDGRAPTAKEKKNHHAGQGRSNRSFQGNSTDRRSNKNRLIVQGFNFQSRWQ